MKSVLLLALGNLIAMTYKRSYLPTDFILKLRPLTVKSGDGLKIFFIVCVG